MFFIIFSILFSFYTVSHCAKTFMPNFSQLKIGTDTHLKPGGDTGCILDSYNFLVNRQDSDKLIIFFHGGGLCWDDLSVKNQLCGFKATSLPTEGMLRRDGSFKSKFQHYTLVTVHYCSGDLHLGNVTRDIQGPNDQPVRQIGIRNVISVVSWLQKQQEIEGNLNSPLKDLVIMGTSSGCYAAMLLTGYIAHTLKYEHAAVFLDSIEIILPNGVFGTLVNNFGICDVLQPFTPAAVYKRCHEPDFTLWELFSAVARTTRDIPYVFTIGKLDLTQRKFYNALLRTSNQKDKTFLSEEEELREYYKIFEFMSKRVPNFVVYLVNGPDHVFTNRDYYYETDALSAHGSPNFNGSKYQAWLESMPLQSVGDTIHSVCEGTIYDTIVRPVNATAEELAQQPKKLGTHKEILVPREEGLTYCLRAVMASSYTQQPHP